MSAEPFVAMFFQSLGCGGVERITVNMVRYLAARGHRVDLLLRVAAGEFLGDLPPTVRVVELGPSHPRALRGLVGYLHRERPRNLLSFMYPQNELALVARTLSGSSARTYVSVRSMLSGQEMVQAFGHPVLCSLHARLVRSLVRWCYPLADGIVTVSDGAAHDVAMITRLPRSRITVIRNPVICPRLFERAEEPPTHRWFTSGGPPVIVAVGRLHPIKDFATLIAAFALVRARRPARLLILGDGPEMATLRRLVVERGVAADVDLPGFEANPYPAIRSAAALALTSRFEALPGVVIEALALGTPVVATDCPSGPAEILRGGRYGELAPVGDPAAIAEAILRVLDGSSHCLPADEAWLDQFREETAMASYLDILGGASTSR